VTLGKYTGLSIRVVKEAIPEAEIQKVSVILNLVDFASLDRVDLQTYLMC
jgi:hypothetical protein